MGMGQYPPAITCFDIILEWAHDIYTLLAKGEVLLLIIFYLSKALYKSECEIAALECFDQAIKLAQDKIKQIEEGVIAPEESFTDHLGTFTSCLSN